MNAAISSSTRVSANSIEACCEPAPQGGYPAQQPDSNLVWGILCTVLCCLPLGIDCPGCGSLRMIYSLLHLDVAGALRYNAFGLVAVLLLVWAFAAWTYGRLVGQQVASWQHLRWSAPVALALTLVWFVVRNLGFGPFPALHV